QPFRTRRKPPNRRKNRRGASRPKNSRQPLKNSPASSNKRDIGGGRHLQRVSSHHVTASIARLVGALRDQSARPGWRNRPRSYGTDAASGRGASTLQICAAASGTVGPRRPSA